MTSVPSTRRLRNASGGSGSRRTAARTRSSILRRSRAALYDVVSSFAGRQPLSQGVLAFNGRQPYRKGCRHGGAAPGAPGVLGQIDQCRILTELVCRHTRFYVSPANHYATSATSPLGRAHAGARKTRFWFKKKKGQAIELGGGDTLALRASYRHAVCSRETHECVPLDGH